MRSSSTLAPGPRASARFLQANRRKTPEEGRNYTLQLLLLHLLQSVAQAISFRSREIRNAGRKRRRGKNTKSGGSDPTFSAFSRPKSLWGRSRPPALVTVPDVFSTVQRSFDKATPRRKNTDHALPAPGEAENAKGKFFGSVVEVLPLRGPLSLVEHDSVRRISTPNFPRNAE